MGSTIPLSEESCVGGRLRRFLRMEPCPADVEGWREGEEGAGMGGFADEGGITGVKGWR